MRFKSFGILPAALTAVAMLLAGGMATSAPAAAADEIVIKADQPSSNAQSWSIALAKVRDLVAERTGGKVKIQIYPDGVLTNRNLRTVIQMLQSGAIQMGMFLPAFYEQFDPRWQIFSFPFLFADQQAAYGLCDGEMGQFLLDTLREKNIQGLALWEHGFRQFTTRDKPMRVPGDMKGMKMRVMSAPTFITMVEGLGANPTATSMGELFTALQQGVVDGQENPISSIYLNRFFEVQNYMTVTNHVWNPWVIGMNAKFFDGLSPDVQKILLDTAKEVTAFERDLVKKADEDMLAKMTTMQKKIQVISLTAEEQKAWKAATAGVHEKFADKIGKDLLQRFYKAAGY